MSDNDISIAEFKELREDRIDIRLLHHIRGSNAVNDDALWFKG